MPEKKDKSPKKIPIESKDEAKAPAPKRKVAESSAKSVAKSAVKNEEKTSAKSVAKKTDSPVKKATVTKKKSTVAVAEPKKSQPEKKTPVAVTEPKKSQPEKKVTAPKATKKKSAVKAPAVKKNPSPNVNIPAAPPGAANAKFTSSHVSDKLQVSVTTKPTNQEPLPDTDAAKPAASEEKNDDKKPATDTTNPALTHTLGEHMDVPLFEWKDSVIFPYSLTPLRAATMEGIRTVKYALAHNRVMAIFPPLPNANEFGPLPFSVAIGHFEFNGIRRSAVGVLVRIVKELKYPDGTINFMVRGLKRIGCETVSRLSSGELIAGVRPIVENTDVCKNVECLACRKNIEDLLPVLAPQGSFDENLPIEAFNAPDVIRFTDVVADHLHINYPGKILVLALLDVVQRIKTLSALVARETEIVRVGMKLQHDVHEAVSSTQKEFFLREQLRIVKQELGEDTRNPDLVDLSKKAEKTVLPERVKKVIDKELGRLEMIPPNAPEYYISYNYVSWLLDVPWVKCSEDIIDVANATKVLDEDHFGLEDVKARILEYLAVLQLRAKDDRKRAPILCLVGPPGVGKTSLGKSIARAMNREFIRVSLGGVRDEAEIRGHRRTYVGAMPGRIIQNMKKVGVCNPVFMLDEIDKLAHDMRGDPASALLETLDPEQNNTFNDNFLELDYDLSKVFFIATANVLEAIPDALRDRMEVIRLPGYTAYEKLEIASRYLVPRQLKESGLNAEQFTFKKNAITEIVDYYTMEAGVRTLERTIGSVCRRLARRVVSGEITPEQKITVTPALVRELLGARKFIKDKARKTPVGCATGMAWTGCGGVILPLEVIAIPGGKGELKLTGSLGKVMQESASIAFSFVRETAAEWGIKPEYFQEHDFHIHFPDGATPKDGPSAGITLALALASLLRDTPLLDNLSMTGEITLLGNVTAIGGVREKVVAALGAGIKDVIMPEENRKDWNELPQAVSSKLQVHFVKNFRDAFKVAFPTGK